MYYNIHPVIFAFLVRTHQNSVLLYVYTNSRKSDNPCFNEGLKALFVCANGTLMSDYDQEKLIEIRAIKHVQKIACIPYTIIRNLRARCSNTFSGNR